jgi:histidine triad (HIT) family protein
MAATSVEHFNVLQNNGGPAHQAVDHVHFHIIPKLPDGRGLGVGWKAERLDPASAAELARKISAAL